MSGMYDSRNIHFGTSALHASGQVDRFRNKATGQSPCGRGHEEVACRVLEEQAA
jgi:hypothetical protein